MVSITFELDSFIEGFPDCGCTAEDQKWEVIEENILAILRFTTLTLWMNVVLFVKTHSLYGANSCSPLVVLCTNVSTVKKSRSVGPKLSRCLYSPVSLPTAH